MSTSGGTSGGGGGTPVASAQIAIGVGFPTDFVFAQQVGFPFDPVAFSGSVRLCAVSTPQNVPPGNSLNVFTPTAEVDGIDTTGDTYDLFAQLFAADVAGANAIIVQASLAMPIVGPDQMGAIDWTTGTVASSVGADLTWNPVTVEISSTAGGIYVMGINLQGSYS